MSGDVIADLNQRLVAFGQGEDHGDLFNLLMAAMDPAGDPFNSPATREQMNGISIDLKLKSHRHGPVLGLAQVMAQHFDGNRMERGQAVTLHDAMSSGGGHPDLLNFLALILARQSGLDALAVDFFGAHLLHLVYGDEQALIDPGQMFAMLEPGDLRALYQNLTGDDREVTEADIVVVDDRVMFVHVLRLAKNRAMKQGEEQWAMQLLERMCLVMPESQDMQLERGLAAGKSGQISRAILQITGLVEQSDDRHIIEEGRLALQRLRNMLN